MPASSRRRADCFDNALLKGPDIGPVALDNPWILAPMAGVSESPFRNIVVELGAAAAPTELISARALIEGTSRSERYLRRDRKREPLFWVQLFGADEGALREGAAAAVERGATMLDFNMGCPVRKVTRGGAGSALLKTPARAGRLVHQLVRGGGVPVTVKIRGGWDENSLSYVELARACADAGAQAIAMHARTRVQGYSGSAQWPWIENLVRESPIPVIGNGDAFTAGAARRMLRQTRCRAVMIGRGALGDPWIFWRLTRSNRAKPRTSTDPTPQQRAKVVIGHFDAHLDHVEHELAAIRRFRKHWIWYARRLRGAQSFLDVVLRLEEREAIRDYALEFFSAASTLHRGHDVPAEFDARRALG